MVRIRLARVGRKHEPKYKIVIVPQREKRNTKFIEEVGSYDAMGKKVELKKERVEYWLSVGAQPSETVGRILVREKLMKAPKFKTKFNDKPGKKASERKEKALAAAEAAQEKPAEVAPEPAAEEKAE